MTASFISPLGLISVRIAGAMGGLCLDKHLTPAAPTTTQKNTAMVIESKNKILHHINPSCLVKNPWGTDKEGNFFFVK